MGTKAQQLFDKSFSKPRDPRSPEYKKGVMDALQYRFGYETACKCPYQPGTAQTDAWIAGTDEGHHIFRESNPATPQEDETK